MCVCVCGGGGLTGMLRPPPHLRNYWRPGPPASLPPPPLPTPMPEHTSVIMQVKSENVSVIYHFRFMILDQFMV